MISIAKETDLRDVAYVHRAALSSSILGRLPQRVITGLYEEIFSLERTTVLVFKNDSGKVKGFIATFQSGIISDWKIYLKLMISFRNWISIFLNLRVILWKYLHRSLIQNKHEISVLAVLPMYQGRGIGEKLINSFMDLNQNGSFVVTDNDRALKFYKKMKFKKICQFSFLGSKRYILANF